VVGPIFPPVEVKLISTPDICDKGGFPYMSTVRTLETNSCRLGKAWFHAHCPSSLSFLQDRRDVDGEPIWGRGEIWARGASITSGYYMMEDKTKEEYTDDGWFKTGDIGLFLEDGSIRIVDRKKNLVKLKSGEYIALEQMEAAYGNSKFVDAVAGGICCYGDGDMDRPVAMLQLNKTETLNWAKANGVSGDFETLMKSKELHAAVLESMKQEHAKSHLSHIEKLQGVALLNSPWTPENGCLTAANKLQRRSVGEAFSKEFDEVKKKGIFN
jgi:long-chain acyl-CoA synthetase